MQKLFIIPIEPIETRYTIHWHSHLPTLFKENLDNVQVIQVDGTEVPPVPSPGAFLDFGATNIYKSSQLIAIAEYFRTGQVSTGDKFLFTDAWNTSILQVKYMSELLGINVELHGLHHAGSYDPQDFLGRLIKDKRWTNCTEKAIYHALDYNWFATDFHIEMFADNVFGDPLEFSYIKCPRTGWPMEYMTEQFKNYQGAVKEDIILFPHRLAPEKQHNIFLDLSTALPEYNFVTCQDKNLSKSEYHKLLAKSKMVFSANLQETLGIGVPEGMAVGAIPCVPDRLSYEEMYSETYKYPSEWTTSFEDYLSHKDKLVSHIKAQMESYDTIKLELESEFNRMHSEFFCATNLIKVIKNDK